MRRLALLLMLTASAATAQTPADTLAAPKTVPSIAPPTDVLLARPSRRDSLRAVREAAVLAAPAGVERRRPLSRTSMLAGNAVAGSVLAAGRGAAEGLPARRLPAVALGGAAAGAAFYGAKALVGEGHTVAGFALAYAAASVAENVAEGGHALGHVRLGLGPLDVRVATPFARGDASGVRLELDPPSVAAAVVLPLQGFRPRACRAGICYRADEELRIVRDGRRFRRVGRTVGRVVRVWPPFTGRTEAHEGIHVIQGMQIAAGTPRGTVREITGRTTDAPVSLDARVDWLAPLVGAAVFSLVPYHAVWSEREAFTLAE